MADDDILEHAPKLTRTLPGDSCAAVPLPEWASLQERWAWDQIACGRIADLSDFPVEQYEDIVDADKPPVTDPVKRIGDSRKPQLDEDGNVIEVPADDWPAWQTLTARFLELILLTPRWRDSQAKRGVHIIRARIEEQIDLYGQDIKGDLWLDSSVIEGGLILQSGRVAGSLSLDGSLMLGPFGADGLQIEGGVLMRDSATFKQAVRLLGAKLGGPLECSASTFESTFNADRLQTEGAVFIDDGATFKQEVRLLGAKLGGPLECSASTFEGPFKADGVQIEGSVYLRDGVTFSGNISFAVAKLRSSLQVWGSRFSKSVDLSGAEITGELQLDENSIGASCPKWGAESRLDLQNAKIGALQGTLKAWRTGEDNTGPFVPRDLSGLTFRRAKGGFGGQSLEDETPDALVDWLDDGSEGLSPSLYLALATALKDSGHTSSARHIRYALGERERKEATGIWGKSFGWLSKSVIGHGYKLHRSILWLAPLAILPAWMGQVAQHDFNLVAPNLTAAGEMATWLRYSIENAVPIVLSGSDASTFLPDRFEDESMLERARWVALLQRLMTTAVLGFVIAGIAGWARQRAE